MCMKGKRANLRLSQSGLRSGLRMVLGIAVIMSVLMPGLVAVLVSGLILTYAPRAQASDIRAPGDYSAIQAAIDAAGGADPLITDLIPTMAPKEIHVYPGESIQGKIDSAHRGDTVIIHEGRYVEVIDFKGKVITVRSIDPNDPDVVAATIIDANQTGSAVTFTNGEDTRSVLSGLTLQNGKSASGGGIYCNYSSPIISKCIISGNTGLPLPPMAAAGLPASTPPNPLSLHVC